MSARSARAAAGLLCVVLSLGVVARAAVLTQQGSDAPQNGTRPDPRFSARVDLVVLRAIVVDSHNRCVSGLSRDNFHLFENNVEQSIAYFFEGDAPSSVGLVLDSSRSMSTNFSAIKQALASMIDELPADELFLMTFNERVRMLHDFTTERSALKGNLDSVQAEGKTALFDAVEAAILLMRRARQPRKVLLVITDGEENSSRRRFGELKELARDSDVQIYVIAEESTRVYGRHVCREISRWTGGRTFFMRSADLLRREWPAIAADLNSQYEIGFTPHSDARGTQSRKLKLVVEGRSSKLKVITRR